jgi:hypothetical protein
MRNKNKKHKSTKIHKQGRQTKQTPKTRNRETQQTTDRCIDGSQQANIITRHTKHETIIYTI